MEHVVRRIVGSAHRLMRSSNRTMTKGAAASSISYRLLSGAVSILFFALYSQFVFVLFMGNEGFFSYDILLSGGTGIGVFFFATELTLVLFAIGSLGVLIPLLRACFAQGVHWIHAVWLGTLNTLVWLRLIRSFVENEQPLLIWFVIFALSALVCIQLAALIYGSAEQSFKSLLIILPMLVVITMLANKETGSLLALGLKHFGVGGDVPVQLEIKNGTGRETMVGRLIFLSPENVFVVLEGEDRMSVIHRSRAEIINIASRKASSPR